MFPALRREHLHASELRKLVITRAMSTLVTGTNELDLARNLARHRGV